MPETTVRAIRRALIAALADGRPYVVSAATTTTLSSHALVDATPDASTARFSEHWVYQATGAQRGQQRRVRINGYTPALGTLTLTVGWTTPSAGDEVEITGLFPAGDATASPHAFAPTSTTSYQDLITRGLALLAVPDRVTMPITTASSYALNAYPWLDRPERLRGVFEPGPVAGSRVVDCGWRGIRLVPSSGGGSALEVDAPFSAAAGVLTLDVLRPAPSLVNGASSTVGPVLDTDTVAVDTDDAVTVCLVEAYRVLMHRSFPRPSGPWSDLYTAQQEQARRLRYYDASREREQASPSEAA